MAKPSAWSNMVARSQRMPGHAERHCFRPDHARAQGAEVGRSRQTRPESDYAGTLHALATAALRIHGFDRNGQPIRKAAPRPSAGRARTTRVPRATMPDRTKRPVPAAPIDWQACAENSRKLSTIGRDRVSIRNLNVTD